MSESDNEGYDELVDDEEPVEPGDDDLHEGDVAKAAKLPDGRFLIVSGPGAGSVVFDADGSEISESAAIPDRDAALDGTRVLTLVHRSRRGAKDVPRLLANVHVGSGGNTALGVVAKLPGMTAASTAGWLDRCAAAAVRVADPLGYLEDPPMDRAGTASGTARKYAPYLAGGEPIKTILDAQREVGANLLLTRGRALQIADVQNELNAACSEGDAALAELAGDERLALNLTLHRDWLTQDAARDALLAQLIDQEQFDVWYIRVLWADLDTGQQPLRPDGLLQGYKILAQTALDEGRTLLLPQTGLTGWLQLSFGAAGFGTGCSGTDQAFRDQRGGGGGGNQEIERYYEPQLLHFVQRDTHNLLAGQSSYLPCGCPYCPQLLDGAAWSYELASLHYVFNAGLLAGRVGGRGREEVRRAVRDAVAAQRAFPPLTGDDLPRHLPVWDQAL